MANPDLVFISLVQSPIRNLSFEKDSVSLSSYFDITTCMQCHCCLLVAVYLDSFHLSCLSEVSVTIVNSSLDLALSVASSAYIFHIVLLLTIFSFVTLKLVLNLSHDLSNSTEYHWWNEMAWETTIYIEKIYCPM